MHCVSLCVGPGRYLPIAHEVQRVSAEELHGACTVCPAGHAEQRARHSMSVVVFPRLNRPLVQSAHSISWLADTLHRVVTRCPAPHIPHSLHPELPACENFPASHELHLLRPAGVEYVPAAHEMQLFPPACAPATVEYLPAAHEMHELAAVARATDAAWYLPATQSVQASAVPPADHFPATQSSHPYRSQDESGQ